MVARPALRERGSVWRRRYDERPGGASIIRIFVFFAERGKGQRMGARGLANWDPLRWFLWALIPEIARPCRARKRKEIPPMYQQF